ncbi:hypothetical protein [Deinococcus kurensis]|uniref:hypothetical protein n=1 Tax=Deinococcus kurensis TaxID=2662757 RepID=UPI0012D3371B|nr:hypothetical protein [Deinococcus kurensis]
MIPVTHPVITVPAAMLGLDPDADYRLSALHDTLYQHVRNRLQDARLTFPHLDLDIVPSAQVCLRDRVTLTHLHQGRTLYFASAAEDHDARDVIHGIATHAATEIRALTARFLRPELSCPQRTFTILRRAAPDAPPTPHGTFTRWSTAHTHAQTLSTPTARAWVVDTCDAPAT